MSNLSFARIMYGTSQENPSPLMPVSNLPSHLGEPTSRGSAHATLQTLLQKAQLVFSHKK